MKCDKSFLGFLKTKGAKRILPILVIGALLLLLGSGELFRGEDDASVSVSTEDRLAELCSAVDGAGRCTAMMSYGSDGEVTAVALLCDGAEIPRVRESLTKLICSLYSIGANRVAIVKRA